MCYRRGNASIPIPPLVAACLLERPPWHLGRNHTNHMIGTSFRLPADAGDQDITYILDWPSSTQTCGTTVPGAHAVEVPNVSASSMFRVICPLSPTQVPTLTPQ